jgi:hypothetical protein
MAISRSRGIDNPTLKGEILIKSTRIEVSFCLVLAVEDPSFVGIVRFKDTVVEHNFRIFLVREDDPSSAIIHVLADPGVAHPHV